MQITLNGQDESIETPTTVAALLQRLSLEPIRVAVEINEEIVSRGDYVDRQIGNGDRIEIVTFVGGG